MRTKYLLWTIAICSLLSACEEIDESSNRIEIFAESMGGSAKVLINGANGTWVNNDSININGTAVAVERHDGHAYISYATPAAVNRAFYPASLKVLSNSGDNATLELPTVYHYQANASGQLLELPMAARSSNSNPMEFMHLTGAICVMVKNTAAVPLTLQSVTLESDRYRLSGSCAVNFTTLQSITPETSTNALERCVVMAFDTGYTLAASGTLYVMLPVLPVGSDNHFTISVRAYRSGQSTAYRNSQSQTGGNDHSLARNELGYAPMSIDASTPDDVLETIGGAYVVSSPLEFSVMAQALSNGWISGTSNITLLSDIDMTDVPISMINRTNFSGVFDGNNHVVRNLTINSVNIGAYDYSCALFRQIIYPGKIKNLILDGLMLNHSQNTTGSVKLAGLIATCSNSSNELINCTVSINSVNLIGAKGAIYFGGLICESEDGNAHINISNCHVSTNISFTGKGSVWWGGLIGFTAGSKTNIINSSWSGTVSLSVDNNVWIGGFVGRKNSNEFKATNCTVDGSINITAGGSYRYLGNLIGLYNTPGTTDITGTTANVLFSLGGTMLNDVENYGINR